MLTFRAVLPTLCTLAALALPLTAQAGGTKCPGPTTLEGIDVSYWQGTIDWAKVKATKKFVIMRVAHGMAQDTKFPANWAGAKGMPRGVYLYFDPAADAVAQANLLLTKMGPMLPGMLPPVLDVESTGGKSPAVVAAQVTKFVNHVKAKIGVDVVIYTGKYFWDDNVKSTAQAKNPLWHAQYCTNCCPNIAAPWNAWIMWQYSSTGKVSGISGNVDTDKWNGTLAALEKFAGLGGCKPACEGNQLVAADCGKSDCAKVASKCVDDDLAPRCVSNLCPNKGTSTVCVADKKNETLGTCKNGALTTGNCGAFGAICSTGGGQAAHCASAFCVASPKETPVEKDVCLPDGKRYHCDKTGATKLNACTAAQKCEMANGVASCTGGCKAHCEGTKKVGTDCKATDCAPGGGTCVNDDLGLRCMSTLCPAKGPATVCVTDAANSKIGTCKDGTLTTAECGAFGAWCSTALAPHQCVSVYCAATASDKPTAKDVCLPGGKRYACDTKGGIVEKACPVGQACVTAGGVATCAGQCQPHCEGTLLVGGDCGKADCATFGSSCVDDALGVRCASNSCPKTGSASVCVDPVKVGACNNGALVQTSCGQGQLCTTAAGKPAHCAWLACVATDKEVPVEHDVCLTNGQRGHCDDTGSLQAKPCGTGETCAQDGATVVCKPPTCSAHCQDAVAIGADCSETNCAATNRICLAVGSEVRCVDPACPSDGVAQVCLVDKGPAWVGVCQDGALQKVDCGSPVGAGGLGMPAWCGKTAAGEGCIAKVCVGGPGEVPEEKDLCTSDGRVHCTAEGVAEPAPCPDDTCNACGGCGPAPVEACNGLDDDCNGVVDDVAGGKCDAGDDGGTANAGGEDASATLDGTVGPADVAGVKSLAAPAKPDGCTAGSRGAGAGMLAGLLLVLGVVVGRRRRAVG